MSDNTTEASGASTDKSNAQPQSQSIWEDLAKFRLDPVMKKVLIWVGVAVALAAIGFLGWKYMEAQKEIQRLANPQEAAQEATRKLVAEVGQFIDLPTDETPTIATVVDASKIKDQPFFAKAENNDRVLIYTKNRKAVLYRPATKKIIEVAPISSGTAAVSGTSTTPTPAPKKP